MQGDQPMELEAAARALYERNCPIAPDWDQLGEATKSTWREDIQRRQAATGHVPDMPHPGVAPDAAGAAAQGDLFGVDHEDDAAAGGERQAHVRE
ncbi:hypothetical protein [Ramlibacter sp. AN1133]|uniref:hypothetical protein n=1 Tax=Ramlibacter sp. AN1133 TaxID=3133429 RepID=UPI0030C110EB